MQTGPLLAPTGLCQGNAKPELVSSAAEFISTTLICLYGFWDSMRPLERKGVHIALHLFIQVLSPFS